MHACRLECHHFLTSRFEKCQKSFIDVSSRHGGYAEGHITDATMGTDDGNKKDRAPANNGNKKKYVKKRPVPHLNELIGEWIGRIAGSKANLEATLCWAGHLSSGVLPFIPSLYASLSIHSKDPKLSIASKKSTPAKSFTGQDAKGATRIASRGTKGRESDQSWPSFD